MGTRASGIAWKIMLLADLSVFLYGVMATSSPEIFSEGYQIFTGQNWSAMQSANARNAAYILLLGRVIGALNIAFAATAISIVVVSFRRGEKWSWYALLIGNTVGYLSPIVFDQIVGAIGIFEMLELFLLALIYVALGFCAKDFLGKKLTAE